ncbi:MAG: hypothetical protein AAGF10_03365 [Verrucomicrobiota bacterium]
MRTILALAILAAVSYFSLSSSILGAIAFHELIQEKAYLAEHGVTTEGIVTRTKSEEAGKTYLYLVNYNFVAEGHENPDIIVNKANDRNLSEMWESMSEEERDKFFPADSTIRSMMEGDLKYTFYGQDTEAAFAEKPRREGKVIVTYDPENPSHNMGGDHANATYWSLTAGYRAMAAQLLLILGIGLFTLVCLLQVLVALVKGKAEKTITKSELSQS